MIFPACQLHVQAGNLPGGRTGNYLSCTHHYDLLQREHMHPGVRVSRSQAVLARRFTCEMGFWAEILDMDWFIDNSRNLSPNSNTASGMYFLQMDGLISLYAADFASPAALQRLRATHQHP